MICAGCGKPIGQYEPRYQSNPMGLGIGQDKFYHSQCGDPFGLKARDATIEQLRAALRKQAVKQHVRLAEGGGTVPNGRSCSLCSAQWDEDQPERHEAACLLNTSANGQ